MPSARTLKRSWNAAQLGLHVGSATTGVWATKLTSGLYSLNKAAASTTSVVNIPIPPAPRGGQPTSEPRTWEDKLDPNAMISVIEVFYAVTTADITNAPTVALNKQTYPSGTGLAAAATVAQTLTFGGIDTIGKVAGSGAAGSHVAIVTITTPAAVADNESLVLTITMGEAASTVLDIFGISVTFL